MKKLLTALSVAMLAILAITPALASPVKGSDGPAAPTESEQRAATRRAKQDEKAYKDALDRIPTSSKKQDPWEKMR